MNPSLPYDSRHHRAGTVAASGRCSQHGQHTCPDPAIASFQDRHGRWQSGCDRAVRELVARGEITPPTK